MEELVSNHKTKQALCLVLAWQWVVNFLLKQYGKKTSIDVNDFKLDPIKLGDITHWIRRAAKKETKLNNNVKLSSFGTHSIRCGVALAMYLSGILIVDIMLQGY